MKLNGWQRLGVVLSALWLLIVLVFVAFNVSADKVTVWGLLAALLLPILTCWVLAYNAILAIRWVSNGFSSGREPVPSVDYESVVAPAQTPDEFAQAAPEAMSRPDSTPLPIAQIIGIGMLVWALVPSNPYGYYVLLRWVICGIFIYLAVEAHGLKKSGWVWTLGIAAAIYNPIVRVHLNRDVWSFVNFATIVFLTITIWVLRRTEKEEG